MIKPYEIKMEEPVTLAEPMAIYGNTALKDYDGDINEELLDEDCGEDQWDINDPEMQNTIKMAIGIGIEQMLQGKCRPAKDVFAELWQEMGWND